MKKGNYDLLTEENKIKMLKKTKKILSGAIVIAILFSLGLLISEIIEESLNQAKLITYLLSILLSVILFFVFVSGIDKNTN